MSLPALPYDVPDEVFQYLRPLYEELAKFHNLLEAASDIEAATKGVDIGYFYHTAGIVKVRLT